MRRRTDRSGRRIARKLTGGARPSIQLSFGHGDAPGRRLTFFDWLAVVVLVISPIGAAAQVDQLSGWHRTFKGRQDGAPPGIQAIAQTSDGFIWIGAYGGLYRYDGRVFEKFAASSRMPLQSDSIDSLLALPNGDLWVGHDWGGMSVVRAGRHIATSDARVSTVVFLKGNGLGSAWLASSRGNKLYVARLDGQRWRVVTARPRGLVTSAAVDRDGGFWLIVDDRLLHITATSSRIAQATPGKVSDASLSTDPNGQVWLIERASVRRVRPDSLINGQAVLGSPIRKPTSKNRGAAVFDASGGFWAADDADVLTHYGPDPRTGAFGVEGAWRSTYPLLSYGSLAYSEPMLIDREGSLWIGASQGLLQFSRSPFTTVVKPVATGLREYAGYASARDGRGDVWIWRNRTLFKVDPDGSLKKQPVRVAEEIRPCASPDGGVWLQQGHRALSLFGGARPRSVALTKPADFSRFLFSTCSEDGSGRVWAAETTGLELLGPGSGGFAELGDDSGFGVASLASGPGGNVFAYVGRGSLWETDGSKRRRVWDQRAMTLGFIEVMYQAGGYLLLGGDRGLVRFDGRGARTLTRDRLPFLDLTTGIVQTAQGETWLQTSQGVVRLRTSDLLRAFDDPTFQPPSRIFGIADGLPGSAALSNQSNITADRQGRIWVVTNNGIARFDPTHTPFDRIPPPIIVRAIDADEASVRLQARTILPVGTRRVRFEFTALSYLNPQAIRFRYRLLGSDPGWVEGGPERTAVYTDLTPGHYTFQVIGANKDGVWNDKGATVQVVLQPRYYQTWWFLALVAAGMICAAVGTYRWRVAAVLRRVRDDAAVRSNERDRIARDIHDTLLQSVQGLVLRFQSVASRMDADDPSRSLLERALDRADQLIADGKARVVGLRASDGPSDVIDAIGLALDEAPFPLEVRKSLVVNGRRAPLAPAVIVEIREIMGEALFNAARHSKARNVVIDVTFGARAFEVSIADDGIGMATNRLEAGESGLGIRGMRERASGIGATFTLEPRSPTGLMGRLRIPARRAYRSRRTFARLRRLRPISFTDRIPEP